MEFTPKYIKQAMDKRDSEIVTSSEWNAILNLLIQQGDHNSNFLAQIASDCATVTEIADMINQKIIQIGSSDMAQAVYDPNGDGIVKIADTVVDNSIATSNIKDNAVTSEKLEETIIKKLEYTYTNVGRLLIFMGGQAEIEGSANLVLFGLDGQLESVYNATSEKTSEDLYTNTLAIGETVVSHDVQDITNKLKINTNYNITNGSNLHRTSLNSITNATLSVSSINQTYNAHSGNSSNYGYFEHISGDYYCACCDNSLKNEDTFYTTIYLLKYDANTNTFITIQSLNITQQDVTEMYKMNGHLYIKTEKYPQDRYYLYQVTTSTITELGRINSDIIRYMSVSKNGNIYWVGHETGEDGYTFYKQTGTQILFVDNCYMQLYQITGKYGFLLINDDYTDADTYYWVDLTTGSMTVTNSKPSYLDHVIPEQGGDNCFYNGALYTLTSSFQLVKVSDISGLPTNFVSTNYNIIKSGNSFYRIRNGVCKKVYSLDSQVNAIEEHTIGKIAINSDFTNGGILYNVVNASTATDKNVYVKAFKYTRGSLTFETANSVDMTGELKICRQQVSTVPANQKKEVYIKPTTKGITYKAMNLIVYLNRALGTGDSVQIQVIAGDTTTTLTPTNESLTTTKYYEHTFSTAASDIEVIITITAGSTGTLQVTQVLGGVDNEI